MSGRHRREHARWGALSSQSLFSFAFFVASKKWAINSSGKLNQSPQFRFAVDCPQENIPAYKQAAILVGEKRTNKLLGRGKKEVIVTEQPGTLCERTSVSSKWKLANVNNGHSAKSGGKNECPITVKVDKCTPFCFILGYEHQMYSLAKNTQIYTTEMKCSEVAFDSSGELP